MAEGGDMAIQERQPSFLHKTSTKIALAGSGLVLAAAGAIGVKTGLEKGGSSPENSDSVAAVPATPQSKEGPQLATPIPSLTPEATKAPAPTVAPEAKPDAKFAAPPEVKKEVPCLVVDQKFCNQAERVLIPLSDGAQVEYLGLKDLPPGTPVYSPVDGFLRFAREGGPQSIPTRFLVTMAVGGAADIRASLRLKNDVQRDVAAGEPLGDTTGEKTLGDYDLLMTITKRTPDGPAVDEDALRKLFPKAFEKPAKPIKQDNPTGPTTSLSYSSTPPQ